MTKKIEERKADHLEINLKENVQAKQVTTGFEDLRFVHKALPEINRKEIDLSTDVFGHKFLAPLIVESMTGGTPKATRINAVIARVVEKLGLGMGVGSQRAALENPKVEATFNITRKEAPNAFILANIGAPQLAQGYGIKEAEKVVKMLDADALLIHLNPLQEAVQPEGETDYAGVIEAIRKIANGITVPVIVKEIGCGIAWTEAKKLEASGVEAIDIAGAGGTSWAAVEFYRAKSRLDTSNQRLGETFWDWGIPTAVSLIETTQRVALPIIASGGLRTGLDVAKAISVGASLVGTAYPILHSAVKGTKAVEETLQIILEELRTAMFLVGADSIQKLRKAPLIVTGKTAEWLIMRGFEPQIYARRGQ